MTSLVMQARQVPLGRWVPWTSVPEAEALVSGDWLLVSGTGAEAQVARKQPGLPGALVEASELVRLPELQARAHLSQEHIETLAEVLAVGTWPTDMPAIRVVPDDEGRLLVVDGHHRIEAAARVGMAVVPILPAPARFGVGAQGALLAALAANWNHGLRRTNADKRRAVHLALENPELRRLSDRALSDLVGVSHVMVSKERQVVTVTTCEDEPRRGRDGKDYPAKGASRRQDPPDAAQDEPRGEEESTPQPRAIPQGDRQAPSTITEGDRQAPGTPLDEVAQEFWSGWRKDKSATKGLAAVQDQEEVPWDAPGFLQESPELAAARDELAQARAELAALKAAQEEPATIAVDPGERERRFTPEAIIVGAKALAPGGVIDLDPASEAEANEVVGAARILTREDDALAEGTSWKAGFLWMNPPFGKGPRGVAAFVERLLDALASGEVGEALVLVPLYSSSAWFKRAARVADVVAPIASRVRFRYPGGARGGSPDFECALLWFCKGEPGRVADFWPALGHLCTPMLGAGASATILGLNAPELGAELDMEAA